MPQNSRKYLLKRIAEKNREIKVEMKKTELSDCGNWYYDESKGEIRNYDGSFFQIKGIQKYEGGQAVMEQPVIIQNEIGYLGIIRKRISGEMHYLMQYKIEPGNINKIQLSPTIQATKSNFTQKHGGRKPAYLEYFVNAEKYKIIVDQIQSEQSSRFLAKRNRNIIIEIDEDIEVLPSHDWMTLKQIKELMRYDNLVNMDTRTVISCLPLCDEEYLSEITDDSFKRSVTGDGKNRLPEIYRYINNYKMFEDTEKRLVPLYSLKSWEMKNGEFVCKEPYSFKVVFCDIEIEGREVKHWTQPLFEASGIATFGLMTRIHKDAYEFLVRATPEIGCFDKIELGPTVQREYVHNHKLNEVDRLFDDKLKRKEGVVFDTLLSEEGGRFYHEQNRNVIMRISEEDLTKLPEGYFWVDYKTLNMLVQVNNCLNIQLRNLLSVLEW